MGQAHCVKIEMVSINYQQVQGNCFRAQPKGTLGPMQAAYGGTGRAEDDLGCMGNLDLCPLYSRGRSEEPIGAAEEMVLVQTKRFNYITLGMKACHT